MEAAHRDVSDINLQTRSSRTDHVRMLTRYKRWANALTFATVLELPEAEALRERPTRWRNIVHTLNHVFVVDDIFRAHLEGRRHAYRDLNTETTPAVSELWCAVRDMDDWYVALADSLTADDLDHVIEFQFVGSGTGAMTREEMVLHVVNHGTYHRGLVADMLYQTPKLPQVTDLPVFLRDHFRPRFPTGA